MAKKNFKKLGRRGLAMFLTLVMVVSLLQVSVFAFENQVMDGHFSVDANGNATVSDTDVVVEDGFTLTKSITQTGKDAFNITLSVETTQTVTTSDAAVQLVIDASTSMDECSEDCSSRYCNHDTRLEAIQKILTQQGGFLDSLASANTGRVYVSVIKFNSGAVTEIDWTDIKTEAGLAAVKNEINTLTQQMGTNIHGGLMLARNRWGMDAVKNVGAKYTILLSDGEAHHSSHESSSTTSISGGGSGNATTKAADMAGQVKAISPVYAVGYGVEKSYLESIVGKGDHVMVGANSATVSAAFANIAQSAVSGMSGAGTTVTDPMGGDGQYAMGKFIVLGDVSSLSESGVSAENNTISWALDPEKADVKESADGKTKTYTYSITYPITLNTAAEGFKEVDENGNKKYYPTNGYTYLSVPQEDGSVKEIAFLVPGVCGEIPESEWHVEYYLQDSAVAGDYANYTLDEETRPESAKLWTSVNAEEGYAEKYDRKDYKFVFGSPTLQITPNGDNVIRLYYDRITADVTVNHYYKTDLWTAEGKFVKGEYSDDNKLSDTETVPVNTDYTAVEQNVYNQGTYELEKVKPSMTINVERDKENVIDLYYTREVDERAITSAAVKHIYVDYGYELDNGKYVLRELSRVERDAESVSQIRATTVFNVSDKALDGYTGYTLNKNLGDYASMLQTNGTLGFTVVEDASQNVRTLVFEKITDERVAAKVVVNHYYTKSVTSVTDGVVSTVVSPNKELGSSVSESIYVGEKFTANEMNLYLGDTYVSDAGNAAKLVVDSVSGDITIDLYYELVIVPLPAQIVVNHYWRTINYKTVETVEEVVNEETGETETVVTGSEVVVETTVDHSEENIVISDLYLGEAYTAEQRSWGEDYWFNANLSNDTGIAGVDVTLNLYYDRYTDEDVRGEAEIQVVHNYVTMLETVVGGEVDIITVNDGSVTESYPAADEFMFAGDEFTAAAQPVYNENEYVQTTPDADLGPVVLQPGTNETIVIDYVRRDSNLVGTDYSVNYEYRTYTMTVVDGVAGYHDEPVVESGEEIVGSGYVGERVSFGDGAKAGFAPLASNPATTQILSEEGNDWLFVYEQYIPLEKGSVVVNHYYKTTTIAIDGTSSVTNDENLGVTVEKYLGESFTATVDAKDFELVKAELDGADFEAPYAIEISGNNVVDFYYEKTVDNSVKTTWTITHIYNHYGWDGELISTTSPTPASGEGYVTNLITAESEPNTYTLVSVTYNGEPMTEAPYTVSLQEGSNDIVITYEKREIRAKVDVTVTHNYYKDAVDEANLAGSTVKVYTDIPEDSEFVAEELIEKHNELVYSFESANPENLTIVTTKEGPNEIVINYLRTAAAYRIVHEYYVNGSLEDSVSSEHGGYVGDEIVSAEIAPVTNHGGNSYSFTSVSGNIVLTAETVGVITLRYDRSFYYYEPASYTLLVNYIDEEGNAVADSVYSVLGEYSDYTTELKDVEGYSFKEVTGDAVSGIMDSNKIVNYIYSYSESVEIPDDDVPLVDIPDDDVPLAELPDEDVPMADVPKTGDPILCWITAGLSALGLLGLGLTSKKRREEEDGGNA